MINNRYSIGDRIQIKNEAGLISAGCGIANLPELSKAERIFRVDRIDGVMYTYHEEEKDIHFYDSQIDHEATAKLNQSKPKTPKEMLEDGFEIVTRYRGSYFVLVKLDALFKKGNDFNWIRDYSNGMKMPLNHHYDAIQIKNREGIIIWQSTEKSPQQIEIERIESEMKRLSNEQSKLAEDLCKLKGEI